MNVLDRISKAKIKLMIKGSEVFLSTLVLGLNQSIDNSIPTAATDGRQIKYNEDFVNSLSDDVLLSLIAHETWHVAYMHMCRRGNRDPFLWNCAADYAINLMLKDNGYTIPQEWLLDEKYRNMSAEEIYKQLEDNADQQPQDNPQDGDFSNGPMGDGDGDSKSDGDGNSGGNGDGDQEGSGQPQYSEEEAKQLEQEIEDKIIKAATAANMSNQAGNIPGHVQRMLDKILNPKLPWNVLLQNYMSAKVKSEKSWSRRNKRFKKVYMPSKLSSAMGDVNIYVDASGSVSDEEFLAYITEMHEIRDSLRPEMMKVISFDTRIKEEFTMEKGEEIEVSFSGGGGTCIGPVVDHAEQETEVDVTIIFTDGYFSDADYTRIPNDVLFVIVNNPNWECNAPNAKVIHMEYNPND